MKNDATFASTACSVLLGARSKGQEITFQELRVKSLELRVLCKQSEQARAVAYGD